MTPAHEQPDLVEAASVCLVPFDRLGGLKNIQVKAVLINVTTLETLRSAIAAERGLRSECALVLQDLREYLSHEAWCGIPCDCGLTQARQRLFALLARLEKPSP